jgi:hypothetical protein
MLLGHPAAASTPSVHRNTASLMMVSTMRALSMERYLDRSAAASTPCFHLLVESPMQATPTKTPKMIVSTMRELSTRMLVMKVPTTIELVYEDEASLDDNVHD